MLAPLRWLPVQQIAMVKSLGAAMLERMIGVCDGCKSDCKSISQLAIEVLYAAYNHGGDKAVEEK